MTIKDSKYVKINSLNPLYLIWNKVNGYFEEINGNKYLMLVPTNGSKIRDLIRLITKKSDDYTEKYMKFKFNSDYELPLNKTIEIPSMIIVVTAIFYENSKDYPQVFLYEWPFEL